MKKFFWAFTPYLVVSILFFVAIGGAEALVPASGESWFFPWTWSLDETRDMIVAGLNGFATITTMAFIGLGLLVASAPAVEAQVEKRRGRPEGHVDPAMRAPDKAAVDAVAQGSTFVESNN